MVPRESALAVLACLLVAGCLGGPTGSAAPVDGGLTTTATVPPTTAPFGSTTTPASTAGQPAYGTQFVSVEQAEDGAARARSTTFENLTDTRQAVFLRALEEGQQRFAPDETNPFDWNDGDRPRFVNYEGEWYYVRVAIV